MVNACDRRYAGPRFNLERQYQNCELQPQTFMDFLAKMFQKMKILIFELYEKTKMKFKIMVMEFLEMGGYSHSGKNRALWLQNSRKRKIYGYLKNVRTFFPLKFKKICTNKRCQIEFYTVMPNFRMEESIIKN